jgi:hypothetical protein
MRALALTVLAIAACGHHDKTITTIDGDVTALAVDAQSLYAGVMTLGKTSIVRVAKSGGAPATLVAKAGIVQGLAVTGGTLAWVETTVESDDGSAATVVTADQVAKAGGIAQAVSAGTDHPARIMSVPLAGGSPTALATFAAVPVGLASDDKDFYVLSLGVWPKGGEIDPTAGSVLAVPRSGGEPRIVVDHLVRASQLALGATDVSYTADGARWKVAKTGGTPQRDGASTPDEVSVVDGATTYRAVKDKGGERTTIVAHTR